MVQQETPTGSLSMVISMKSIDCQFAYHLNENGFDSVLIEVDGGICLETALEAADAGSDILVSGSSVFKGNIGQNVHDLLEAMNHSEKKV